MDCVVVGWKGVVNAAELSSALSSAGFFFRASVEDPEVVEGIGRCARLLHWSGYGQLRVSPRDKTSNGLTVQLFDQILSNSPLKLVAAAKSILDAFPSTKFWLAFAHDWPLSQNARLARGSPQQMEGVLRVNSGAFDHMLDLSTGAINPDLDTPLLFELRAESA